jgi:hypothetical protein
MKLNKKAIKYYRKNWKLFLHLLLRTKKFGVNNQMWNEYDSIFGLPTWKKIWRILIIKPLLIEWTKIKFRAVACHFISDYDKKIIGLDVSHIHNHIINPSNLTIGMRVQNDEGNVGTVEGCEDIHNVYIKYDHGGYGLYCLVEGCIEEAIVNEHNVEIPHYDPLYYYTQI